MKTKIIAGIVAVVIAGGAFYGGMAYAKSAQPMRGNFTQFSGRGGMGGTGGGAMRGGGFSAGQIISKDATSVTIKMQDGSTKIVLVATSTPVMKSASGSLNDLTTGTDIVVTGSTNSDGSLTAQSIQIRPAGSAGLTGRPNAN